VIGKDEQKKDNLDSGMRRNDGHKIVPLPALI